MTEDHDPFAPIDNAEATVDCEERSNSELDDAVVIMPPPSDAEDPWIAATRLFGREPDFLWRYNDQGGLLFVVGRWDFADAGKKYLPLCWVKDSDGREGWDFKQPPAPRPLYRLNVLFRQPNAPVLVVEGEKCVDAARAVFLEFVVTTSPGGAGAADKADWSVLAGRQKVLIFPDADKPGIDYGQQVASILHELGVPEIHIVDASALAARTHDGSTREPPAAWDIADALEEGWPIERLRTAIKQNAKPWQTPELQTEWSDKFEMTSDGLAILRQSNGEDEKILFTGLFTVVGEGRDCVGAGRGLWIEWVDRDNRPQRGYVRHADLVGDGVDWLKDLTDRGFPGPVERQKIGWLRQALHLCGPAKRITMVQRTGWVGSTFVLPDKTIGNTDGETIMFGGRADSARYAEQGNLEEWKEKVATVAAGNPRILFPMSAAFAGPIEDFLEEPSFGFNFVGSSSIGKTAAVIGAGSVWGGGGPLGFALSWRTTDNAAENIFSAHSGTVVAFDEFGQLPAEVASAIPYMFGNGYGKNRATRNGDARKTAQWRGILLSTGEVGIGMKIDELGRGRKAKAGQLVRLPDVPMDAGKGHGVFDDCQGKPAGELAQHLKRSAITYYGTAGPAFVLHLSKWFAQNLAQAKAELRARIEAVHKRLLQDLAGDGQIVRVAGYFALVAVAGELARSALNLPWRDGEAVDAARICFESWRNQRGGSDRQEVLNAIDALREAIEKHGPSRFQRLNGNAYGGVENATSFPMRDLLGYQFDEHEEIIWGFTTSGLKEVLRGIGEFTDLVRELVDGGVIRRGTERIQSEKKIEGKKRRLYAVPDSLISGTENSPCDRSSVATTATLATGA
jgi:putative DNA primase/helicase